MREASTSAGEPVRQAVVVKPGVGNCPRCQGFVYQGCDIHGDYISCVNCGGCWHLESPLSQAGDRLPGTRGDKDADEGTPCSVTSSPVRQPPRTARGEKGKGRRCPASTPEGRLERRTTEQGNRVHFESKQRNTPSSVLCTGQPTDTTGNNSRILDSVTCPACRIDLIHLAQIYMRL